MPKGPFTAEEFIATQWNTAENKAEFGNHLLRFIEARFPQNLFKKTLYNRLSMCFQQIAHCDIHGFYAEWFTTPGDQARFLTHALRSPGYGDPAYTYSDVEKRVQDEIRRRNYVAIYSLRAAEAQRSAELALLERLESKYRQPLLAGSDRPAIESANPAPPSAMPNERVVAIQQSLF